MRLLVIYTRFITKKMLFVIYLSVFVYLFFALKQPFFILYTLSYPNPLYAYVSELSLFIYSINILIIFGLTTSVLEYLLAYFDSSAKLTITTRKNAIHKKINLTLFDFLTTENKLEANKKYIDGINRMFITDYPRLVFINRLRRIMSLTTGESHDRCILLFNLMQPESLIKTYLKSPYKRHKLFALKVISSFSMVQMRKYVLKLMQKKDIDISSEAIYTFIKITPNTNLTFLITRNKQISKLDFYNIVQLVEKYRNVDHKALISCELSSISALGLRLVNVHNERNLKRDVLKRIDHQDEIIRTEAQNTLINFFEKEDIALFLNQFDIFSNQNQLIILNLISEFSNSYNINRFLENIIETKNNNLKLLAMKLIMNHNFMAIAKYRNHENENIRNIYKQVTDLNL